MKGKKVYNEQPMMCFFCMLRVTFRDGTVAQNIGRKNSDKTMVCKFQKVVHGKSASHVGSEAVELDFGICAIVAIACFLIWSDLKHHQRATQAIDSIQIEKSIYQNGQFALLRLK